MVPHLAAVSFTKVASAFASSSANPCLASVTRYRHRHRSVRCSTTASSHDRSFSLLSITTFIGTARLSDPTAAAGAPGTAAAGVVSCRRARGEAAGFLGVALVSDSADTGDRQGRLIPPVPPVPPVREMRGSEELRYHRERSRWASECLTELSWVGTTDLLAPVEARYHKWDRRGGLPKIHAEVSRPKARHAPITTRGRRCGEARCTPARHHSDPPECVLCCFRPRGFHPRNPLGVPPWDFALTPFRPSRNHAWKWAAPTPSSKPANQTREAWVYSHLDESDELAHEGDAVRPHVPEDVVQEALHLLRLGVLVRGFGGGQLQIRQTAFGRLVEQSLKGEGTYKGLLCGEISARVSVHCATWRGSAWGCLLGGWCA
eukprot:1178321-Prorocentrum_minimum.AAC.4